MEGKLIVIDGSDASGKKTQTELLVERLRKKGIKVKTLDFPQYDSFFGKMVAAYLHGEFGSLKGLNPKIPSLLYALDRYGQKEILEEWLKEGNIVVLDRYMESNISYQTAKLEDEQEKAELRNWIMELEFDKLKIPRADMVIYLNVPFEISSNLIKSRPRKNYLNGKDKDIHERDEEYQKKVAENYIKLSKTSPRWFLIECTKNNQILSKEEIAEKVWNVVEKEI
ncbi:dTMP kinase [Candidatus Woesearchaeota archaeon]|nr:dTMP kinase [Candidatus Woesearchaeota archaeon]